MAVCVGQLSRRASITVYRWRPIRFTRDQGCESDHAAPGVVPTACCCASWGIYGISPCRGQSTRLEELSPIARHKAQRMRTISPELEKPIGPQATTR